jgi:multidrug transporter EmrE-like cation transporter
MDLALLVYGISLLEKFQFFFGIGLAILFVASFVTVLARSDDSIEEETAYKIWKRCGITAVCFALILTILPNEKTAYTMVGAYAAQKIAQDPRTQEVGNKVLTIINQKLDGYVADGVAEAEKRVKAAVNGKDGK